MVSEPGDKKMTNPKPNLIHIPFQTEYLASGAAKVIKIGILLEIVQTYKIESVESNRRIVRFYNKLKFVI